MLNLPINEGAEALGVWLMNDSVNKNAQERINNKADEIMDAAWREFENWLEKQGFEFVNGIIRKRS
jgi:hypothetical protein